LSHLLETREDRVMPTFTHRHPNTILQLASLIRDTG
jgi:hypothetical protein